MAINDVSLTSGMRSNLLSLQNTVNLLNRTQNRLSSGKKVNTAIDNPVSYFASQSLTSRASLIDSLKDAMGQAVQTITAADKGITAITSMIEQAKGIAQSALSATSGSSVTTGSISLSGISSVVGTGFSTGDITIAGLTAPTSTGFATGTITLAGITTGAATGKDTGTLTITAAMTAGDTVEIGGVTFTATTGATGNQLFDITSATTIGQAGQLATAINMYGWGVGDTTYNATDNGDGTVSITKNNTADGSLHVIATNMTGNAKVDTDVTAGTGDQIVIGGLTFKAVSDNASAAAGEFLASGTDAMKALSLKAAMDAAAWGANTFTATVNGAVLTLDKTVTAGGAGANFVITDVVTTGANSHASAAAVAVPTGDTIIVGGITLTAVNTGSTGNQFNVTGTLATDLATLAAKITATVTGYTATVADGKLHMVKADADFTNGVNDINVNGISAGATVAINAGHPADTIRIGTASSIGAVTADEHNFYNGTVAATGNYNATTDKDYLISIVTAGTVAGGNIGYKYSTDNGVTWSAAQTVANDGTSTLADGITLNFTDNTVGVAVGDKFTVSGTASQGITFTAVAANPINTATTHQFLANSTNNTVTMESLKDAINATDWSGKTYTFTATTQNGQISIEKTLTSTGADSPVASATDFLYTKAAGNTGSATMADVAPSNELTDLVSQYATMRSQIDALAENSGYKGKNLLSADTTGLGKLTVKFENTTLIVQGFDATTGTDGLNIAAADSGTTRWSDGTAAINASIDQLDAALNTLRQNSSKLAGNLSIITVRQDFSTNMINTLTEGSDKLTLADANEEGANMLMLQTRQSLSTSALSMSAQAAQSVLRLFQ